MELTDEKFVQLIAMIRIHCTRDEICDVLGLSVATLDRRLKEMGHSNFDTLHKKHSGEGKASLRRQQWKSAEGGNPTMLIWLGKQWLGQTDKQTLEHTGEGGGPVQVSIDAKALSDGALAELLAARKNS